MREIKFRIFHPLFGMSPRRTFQEFVQQQDSKFLQLDPMPKIMQYTGLHDKNGKEIYEGDILTFYNHVIDKEETGKIIFTVGTFAIVNSISPIWFNLSNRGEVIGNIYENPDLLGDK